MDKTIEPTADRLLVRIDEEGERNVAGIVIPQIGDKRPDRGQVLAVGPGTRYDNGTVAPINVAVGDRVVFSKYGGTEIVIDGEELLIVRESDLLARIEGEDD